MYVYETSVIDILNNKIIKSKQVSIDHPINYRCPFILAVKTND